MTGNDDAAWWKDLAVRNLDRPALKMAGPRASETDVAAARVQAARQRPDLVRIAETGTPYCDRQSAGAESPAAPRPKSPWGMRARCRRPCGL